MSLISTLARLEAVSTGRAQPAATVRHRHLSQRPLVFVPLTTAGEAGAPLGALVGTDRGAPHLLAALSASSLSRTNYRKRVVVAGLGLLLPLGLLTWAAPLAVANRLAPVRADLIGVAVSQQTLAVLIAGLALGLYVALVLRAIVYGDTIYWSLLWDTGPEEWLPFLAPVTVIVFLQAGLYAPRERRAGAGRILAALVLVALIVLAFALGAAGITAVGVVRRPRRD